MRTLSVSKDSLYIIYYLTLLLLMFFLLKPNVEISMSVRIILFGLTFLPVFFIKNLLPFVFLLFYGISSSSFSPILPTSVTYYLILVLVFYLLYNKKSIFVGKALLLFSYFFTCSLLHLDLTNILSWWFVYILLADMIRSKKDLQMVFYAFLIISLFLSVLFLVHRKAFLIEYSYTNLEAERSGWINPNVFGAAIAAGGVLSMAYLTGFLKFEKTKFLTTSSLVIFLISFLVLILNASRGALLAFALPSLIMIFMSKLKLWIKILLVVASAVFSVLLYQNGVFDLLIVRLIEDNTTTGGGRTEIWECKFDLFFSQSNIFELLFGIGKTATNELGGFVSTHNDIVTSIIGFGIVGFLLFIYYMVLYPIKIASKNVRLFIILLTTYTFVEYMVLEPVFRATPFFMMFYFFILRYVMIEKLSFKTI